MLMAPLGQIGSLPVEQHSSSETSHRAVQVLIASGKSAENQLFSLL
jgi:hypothetical protein